MLNWNWKNLFLSTYLIKKNKIQLFKDVILSSLNFERKVKILKEICDLEKIQDKDLFEEIVFVKDTRNKIAHYLAEYLEESNEYILKKRPSLKQHEDTDFLKVTDKLVIGIGEKYDSIRLRLYTMQNKLVEKRRFLSKPLADYYMRIKMKEIEKKFNQEKLKKLKIMEDILLGLNQIIGNESNILKTEEIEQLSTIIERLREEETIIIESFSDFY